MTNQGYESELRIQPSQINKVNELSIASIAGIDTPTPKRRLQLQSKDGIVRLGLSIENSN